MDQAHSILFCSYHCCPDSSSGAAIAMRQLLSLLAERGHRCAAFTGPRIDVADTPPEAMLGRHGIAGTSRGRAGGSDPFSILHWRDEGVAGAIFRPQTIAFPPSLQAGYQFIALLEAQLERLRPHILLTYGGDWIERMIVAAAKRRGIPVVFWLRNCLYEDPQLFEAVDAAIVPSSFTQSWYEQRFDLPCTVIPSPIEWRRVQCDRIEPRYLTFINPDPNKGVFFFAGIARQLALQRPDIPVLVVESRGNAAWLEKAGLKPGEMPNLRIMPHTPDPREFYRLTRAIVLPSLWQETFMRVGAEAIINGIPVLASRRGGIPETLRDSGFLFDIAGKFTPPAELVPTAEEVQPWLDVIQRLWDDEAFYQAQRRRALAVAPAYAVETIRDAHEAFLDEMIREAAEADPPDPIPPIAQTLLAVMRKKGVAPAVLAAQEMDSLLG